MSAFATPTLSERRRWWRAFEHWLAFYRRTWRGSIFSTVLEPLGYLAAMGVGLATLVNRGNGGGVGGVGYLQFVAPGILAAVAMQTASFESTYPVMGAVKWNKQYVGMMATPLRPIDAFLGHLLFVMLRITIAATVFAIVIALFHGFGSWLGVFCVPVAVLTGLAYAPAIFAFTVTRENDAGFAMLYRFGIVPMFLFSGTFFPVSQLPDWLEPLAWVVPLWHGVTLSRGLALGSPGSGVLVVVHVAYLAAWALAGGWIAARCFERRLIA
ncbi:MAG: ABC transporter permease [Actinomycetales bacterium]